jgi:hypothetical protein
MLYSLNFPFEKGGILDPAEMLNIASIVCHKQCSSTILQRGDTLTKLILHYYANHEPIRSQLVLDLSIIHLLLYDLMYDV